MNSRQQLIEQRQVFNTILIQHLIKTYTDINTLTVTVINVNVIQCESKNPTIYARLQIFVQLSLTEIKL